MSAHSARWSVIAVWVALATAVFAVAGAAPDLRSWGIFVAAAVVPPAMLLWLWNEDRPNPLGTLRTPGRRP